MSERFELIEKRLDEKMDKRFELFEKRLELVEKRREKPMDETSALAEKRRELIKERLEPIEIEEMATLGYLSTSNGVSAGSSRTSNYLPCTQSHGDGNSDQ